MISSILKVCALVVFTAPVIGCASRARVRIVATCNPDPDTQSLLCFNSSGLYYEVPYKELNRSGEKYACTLADDFKFLLEEIRKK